MDCIIYMLPVTYYGKKSGKVKMMLKSSCVSIGAVKIQASRQEITAEEANEINAIFSKKSKKCGYTGQSYEKNISTILGKRKFKDTNNSTDPPIKKPKTKDVAVYCKPNENVLSNESHDSDENSNREEKSQAEDENQCEYSQNY